MFMIRVCFAQYRAASRGERRRALSLRRRLLRGVHSELRLRQSGVDLGSLRLTAQVDIERDS